MSLSPTLKTDSQEIYRYDGATGNFIDVFVTAGQGGLSGPIGMTLGSDGHFYVSSRDTHEIMRYNGTTGASLGTGCSGHAAAFACGGGLNGPQHPVFGSDGNLYMGSLNTSQVIRFDGTTGAFIDVFASGEGLSIATGIAFGPDGNLYVSSRDTDQVLRYDGTTGAFIDVFVATGSGGLNSPQGLQFF